MCSASAKRVDTGPRISGRMLVLRAYFASGEQRTAFQAPFSSAIDTTAGDAHPTRCALPNAARKERGGVVIRQVPRFAEDQGRSSSAGRQDEPKNVSRETSRQVVPQGRKCVVLRKCRGAKPTTTFMVGQSAGRLEQPGVPDISPQRGQASMSSLLLYFVVRYACLSTARDESCS